MSEKGGTDRKMKNRRWVRILTYFYLAPFGLMVAFNTFNSLLRTTYFDLYQYVEAARYKWDNPVILIPVSGGVILLFYFISRRGWGEKVNVEKLALCFCGAICLFIVLLFRCVATCDSETLSDIATEFLKGNYQSFEKGEYLYRYSFQTGMIALLELIYRIFGVENFIVFQIINIAAIVVILRMLQKITWEIFADRQICRWEAVLSMGMFPLFLFSTFVYGDIIGWAFGTGGIYFVLRYLKTDRCGYILRAALLFAAGVAVKSNINILVVAAVIAILLHSIEHRSCKPLIWVIGIVLISQSGVWIVNNIYLIRAGLEEFPAGIPKIAWIAMGMQEGDEGGYACGWYNGYNWMVYEENGFDRILTIQACMENLMSSLERFFHEQRFAIDFFYKKFTSQWNAPAFQAMITNEWNSRYVENLSPLAHFFIYGFGRDILYSIMNLYHFFIFLCTIAFSCIFPRKWTCEKAYFVLNIFGGFLFHMIWEAQSRYILGYFVLMLPLAASGLYGMLSKTGQVIERKNIKENK